jgi:hypothetical protein
MSTRAETELQTAERHLGWGAESIQRAADEAIGATSKGALAVALADLEHVRQRLHRILSLISSGTGNG